MPTSILKVKEIAAVEKIIGVEEAKALGDVIHAEFKKHQRHEIVKVILDFDSCEDITGGAGEDLGESLGLNVIRRDSLSREWYIQFTGVAPRLLESLAAGLRQVKRVVAVTSGKGPDLKCRLIGWVGERNSKVDKEPYSTVLNEMLAARAQVRPAALYAVTKVVNAVRQSARRPQELDKLEIERSIRRIMSELYLQGLLVKLHAPVKGAPYVHIAWFHQ